MNIIQIKKDGTTVQTVYTSAALDRARLGYIGGNTFLLYCRYLAAGLNILTLMHRGANGIWKAGKTIWTNNAFVLIPRGVCFDGKNIFAATYYLTISGNMAKSSAVVSGNMYLNIIDAKSSAAVTSWNLGIPKNYNGLDFDGKYLYMINRSTSPDRMLQWLPQRNSIPIKVKNFPLSTDTYKDFTFDGKQFWATDNSTTIQVFARAKGVMKKVKSISKTALGITTDGDNLYITDG